MCPVTTIPKTTSKPILRAAQICAGTKGFSFPGRAEDDGVQTKIACQVLRATGIMEFLRNGGKLEVAQRMANHESARTTGLYDRRNDRVSLDEVERILI